MDLEQLRTLIAAAEEGSLSAAARRRHLTQPAVSLQVKALEEEVGTPLFHRWGRGVEPTEAGRAVLRHAREALRSVEAARSEAAQVRGLERGRVRLGLTDAAATGLLPRVFAPFHRRYPGIEVEVEVGSTGPLLARLEDGRVDLVLGTLPVEDAEVEAVPLVTERLFLVAPPAAAGMPLRRLLEREAFIAYPRDATTRRLVDAALDAAGLPVRPAMEIGRPSVMVTLVEAGLGVSVLPRSVTDAPVRRGTVVRVGTRRLSVRRSLGMFRLRRRALEPAARAFAEILAS